MENHHTTFQIQAKILIMEEACFVGHLQLVSIALIALLFFSHKKVDHLSGREKQLIEFCFCFYARGNLG